MKTYESCGTLDAANKTVTAYTFLPNKPELNFRYIHFFNISTSSHYGVMGIFVHDGTNVDWSTEKNPVKTVIPGFIDLEKVDDTFSKIKFDDLTEDDEVVFICFHDDEFNTTNLGVEEVIALQNWQKMLPLFGKPRKGSLIEIEQKIASLRKEGKVEGEPKVGNGGILTVTGCP